MTARRETLTQTPDKAAGALSARPCHMSVSLAQRLHQEEPETCPKTECRAILPDCAAAGSSCCHAPRDRDDLPGPSRAGVARQQSFQPRKASRGVATEGAKSKRRVDVRRVARWNCIDRCPALLLRSVRYETASPRALGTVIATRMAKSKRACVALPPIVASNPNRCRLRMFAEIEPTEPAIKFLYSRRVRLRRHAAAGVSALAAGWQQVLIRSRQSAGEPSRNGEVKQPTCSCVVCTRTRRSSHEILCAQSETSARSSERFPVAHNRVFCESSSKAECRCWDAGGGTQLLSSIGEARRAPPSLTTDGLVRALLQCRRLQVRVLPLVLPWIKPIPPHQGIEGRNRQPISGQQAICSVPEPVRTRLAPWRNGSVTQRDGSLWWEVDRVGAGSNPAGATSESGRDLCPHRDGGDHGLSRTGVRACAALSAVCGSDATGCLSLPDSSEQAILGRQVFFRLDDSRRQRQAAGRWRAEDLHGNLSEV